MNFDILIFWHRNQNKHTIINQERTVRFLNPIIELADFQADKTLKWSTSHFYSSRNKNSYPYIKDIKKTILNIRKNVESSMKYMTVANYEYSKRIFLR